MTLRKIFFIILLSTFATSVILATPPFRAGSVIKESREALANYDFIKAINLTDSVLTHSNNQLSKLEALEIQARAFAGEGRLSQAEAAFLKVMEESRSLLGDNSSGYLNSLYNYAQFLMLTGRYEDCINLTREISEPENSALVIDLLGLKSSALMWMGKYDEAMTLLDDAISMAIKTGIPEQTVAVLYQNRGFLNNKIKDYKGAISDYNRAYNLLTNKNKGIMLGNLAISQAFDGDIQNAMSSIEKALDILKEYGETDEDYIIALRKKGEILALSGKSEDAAKIMNNFFNLEKDRLLSVLPTLSPQARLNYWMKEKPLLSKIFIVGESNPSLAFDAALLRRQTTLLGANKNKDRQLSKIAETSRDILQKLKDNEAAVAFVLYEDIHGQQQNAAIVLNSKGKAAFINLFPQDSIYQSLYSNVSLYESIISSDPKHKNILYNDSTLGNHLWQPILKCLPTGVNTIHFAPEGIFHLWGIENMPFNGKDNYSLVRHFSLNEINGIRGSGFKDAKKFIAGGFDYDAANLNDTENPNEKDIQTEAYAEILRTTQLNEGDRIFQYLPGTLKETSQIHQIYPDALFKTQLTEEEFKKKAKDWNIIHLSTHGYSLSNDLDFSNHEETDSIGYDMSLWLSGLALSGANVEALKGYGQDGILSAREICDLDLSGASLVVLSACQTAQGLINDESASGLIRALKNAGAETIVASLWEVDDNSTALFMVNFHKALEAGMSRNDAFDEARRLTQNHIINYPKRKFNAGAMASRPTGEVVTSSPYQDAWYWAPFIIIDP